MIAKPQPTVMPHRTETCSVLDISIIIVNHNVKHLLLQCLRSVEQALQGLSGEIIVVDSSADSTPERVRAARQLADRLHPTLDIEVDGGVNLETGRKVSTAGATVLVAGHFTFSHPNGAKAAIAQLHGL